MDIYNYLELLPEDLHGWNGNSRIFEDLIENLKPSIIVEVGTWKGQSAVTMGKIVNKLNLSTKIYCIDTWLGALEFITTGKDNPELNLLLKNGYPQVYYQFLSNVVHNNLKNTIIPIPTTSSIGWKYLKYHNIEPELIYIDGSHEEEDVIDDIENYFKILKDGGIIFGDDYYTWEGVRNAVNTFTTKYNLSFDVLENNFWVIKK